MQNCCAVRFLENTSDSGAEHLLTLHMFYFYDVAICYFGFLCVAELLIPERANVFYALNNSVDLNFIVRRRSEQESLKDRKKGRRRLKKLSL